MAANFKTGSLGKRIAGQILAGKRSGIPIPAVVNRLGVVAHYSSTYDKNVEEQVLPAVVPDHVIGYPNRGEEKYWGPHPETGVFGPAGEEGGAAVVTRVRAGPGNGGTDSVLDQAAWFRSLEVADVEKPHN